MKIEDVKIGMKVRIVKDPGRYHYGSEQVGRILTVFSIKLDRFPSYVFCEEFECGNGAIDVQCVEPYSFTKADLKTGMRVQYRDGTERVVCKERLLTSEAGSGSILSLYDNDSLKSGTDACDIMKVWAAPDSCEDFFNLEVKGPLLWEREEKTAEQIKKEELSAKMDSIKQQLDSLQEEYNSL